MNPSEQRDLEDVFGPEGAAKVAGFTKGPPGAAVSDRYAENFARRKGSALPDMRNGGKVRGHRVTPLNPQEGGDDGQGSFELPQDTAPPKGARFRKPVVDASAMRKVRNKAGNSYNTKVALTLEEYRERMARLEVSNAEALAAARADREAVEKEVTRLGLPLSPIVDKKLQPIDAQVRKHAAETVLRRRPRPTPIDLHDDHCDSCKDPDYNPGCANCPCDCHRLELDDIVGMEESRLHDLDLEDEYSLLSDSVEDDHSQWQLDHAAELAEDALLIQWEAALAEDARLEREECERRSLEPWIAWITRSNTHRADTTVAPWEESSEPGIDILRTATYERAAYAEAGIFKPPDEDFEYEAYRPRAVNRCVHCNVNPIQTKKDGLCRTCKVYKTKHKGELPPQKVIDSRKRKKGLA